MPAHFPYLLDPTIYPDYHRRSVRVPTWETFGNRPQFSSLRDLSQPTWREDLIRYTEEFKLGRVLWPHINLFKAPHLKEVIEEIRHRDLFLFDIWGHVPGAPAGGPWTHVTPPSGLIASLQQELGDHFLGVDNGEQDGRYVGTTGQQQCPSPLQHRQQYRMFQRHFQKLCGELGNQMSALVSLCFGHYFLKEGNHFLLGAETAQSLPNSQLYYAFIRGACRQYGVLWFGAVSCFNAWGWKDYGPQQSDGWHVSGPDQGASLNLHKRLIYTHYLYNCAIMGFEMNWLMLDEMAAPDRNGVPRFKLTPMGIVHRGVSDFVDQHGPPGVMHAPVALLLDFYAGWAPPRHMYSGNVYQVWGGMPYQPGDYLTHGLFSLLYPGYEDSGFYHNEQGFLSDTPFGDMTDALLSDAPAWVINQYGLVIAAGHLELTCELRQKLLEFVSGGGHLVVTAANARGWLPEFAPGPDASLRCAAGALVTWSGGSADCEDDAFDLYPATTLPATVEIMARCAGQPAVVRLAHGAGRVTVLLSEFGLNAEPLVTGRILRADDTPLASPFRLLRHVRRAFDAALAEQQLFEVGDGLGFVTCRKAPGEYVLGIHNNGLSSHAFQIQSRCGSLRQVQELVLDQSEKGLVGYWPTGMGNHDGGRSDTGHIAGGDIRLFAVRVDETNVQCRPAPCPPPPPRNRFLALRTGGSIQAEILDRSTFFQHFDGVKVDATYFRDRDRQQLHREVDWLKRQRVRIAADLSPIMNLFPDLTLLENVPAQTEASRQLMADVLDKMALVGATELILTLHRSMDCGDWSTERIQDGFVIALRALCQRAAGHGVTVHLQSHPQRWAISTDAVCKLIDAVAVGNLRVALPVGHLAATGESMADALKLAGDRLGCVLHAAPHRDLLNQFYDAHRPIHTGDFHESPVAAAVDTLHILDAVYANPDEEYLDCQALQKSSVRYSPAVTAWRMLPLCPKSPGTGVRAAAAPANTGNWPTIRAGTELFVNVHNLVGDADGLVYLANNFRVIGTGLRTIWLGHDGGVKVFVDGRDVLCVPERRNPIDPWRSRVEVLLAEGQHEVVVALDTDHGGGWGIVFRWEQCPGSEHDHTGLRFPERID